MTFEEEYKGKTRQEIDQEIKALQSQYSSMPSKEQEETKEKIAYLENLSKKHVAKENTFEEEYKGKTRQEIDQDIKALQSQYSSMPPKEQEETKEKIAYLENLSKKLVEKLVEKPVEKPVKKPVKEKAQEFLEGAKENAQGFLENTKEKAQGFLENTKEKAQGFLEGAKENAQGFLENTKEKAQGFLEGARNTKEKAQEFLENTKENAQGFLEGAKRNQIKDVADESTKSKGGSTVTTTTTGDNGGGQGEGNNPPKNEGHYKSSMYGILDAMRNGDIDKSTGLYFMLDALSKAARNTGIDIGNIGAQFTGGTVRNDYQDSLWNQRKDKMFENEVTAELNKQEGTDKEMDYNLAKEELIGKGLSNEQADLMLDTSRKLKDSANKFRAEGNATLAGLYDVISSGAASGNIDVEEIVGIVAAGVLDTPEGKAASKNIIELLSNLGQVLNTSLGKVNNVANKFNGFSNGFSNGINVVISLLKGNI